MVEDERILPRAAARAAEETNHLREWAQKKVQPGALYFRASHIPEGDGAKQKLLKYCKPKEVTNLCIINR